MSFLPNFMSILGEMEPPANLNRWSGLVAISSILGRNFYFRHGTAIINPNLYVMFLGSSGTRKSTPIKFARKVLKLSGYEHIAAEKTSKEKFLMDLAGVTDDDGKKIVKDLNSFLRSTGDTLDEIEVAECLVAADEANDFLGQGNLEFLSMLGSLWDHEGWYSQKFKNSKEVKVWNPTINMLMGNTPIGFAAAFPPEALGQGFFSRTLLIHAEPSGRKIAFPRTIAEEEVLTLAKDLLEIKVGVNGEAKLTPGAYKLLEEIYEKAPRVDDVRFDSYSTRRFTHLLKLCLIVAASHMKTTIGEEHVIEANTVLAAAEFYMPRALGEFGKAKNSDIAHKVLSHLESSQMPLSVDDLFGQISSDLDTLKGLVEVIQKLIAAEKIIRVADGIHAGKFIPRRSHTDLSRQVGIDLSFLTSEERRSFQ